MKLIIDPNALRKLDYPIYSDILTVKEARAILRIGRISVYHLIESDQIEAFQIGRTYKIPKKSLAKFLQTRGEQS